MTRKDNKERWHPVEEPKPAPDPSDIYERAHPEHESGFGRLDSDEFEAAESPDAIEQTIKNRQDGSRQVNAHELADGRAAEKLPPDAEH